MSMTSYTKQVKQAIINNDAERLKQVLRDPVRIRGKSMLEVALDRGASIHILRILAKYGVEPQAVIKAIIKNPDFALEHIHILEPYRALYMSIIHDRKQLFQHVYSEATEEDISLVKEGKTLLHAASRVKDSYYIIQLTRHNIPITQSLTKKRTPFHYAAYQGSNKVMEILLSYTRNGISLQDWEGNTPLHLANTLKKVEMLLEYVDPCIINKKGENFLHRVARLNIPEQAWMMLLKSYPSLASMPDNNGFTPERIYKLKK